MYERDEGVVLLVMDVKGFKLDVIRTTRFYDMLYMDTMEWKDGAVGVWVVKVYEFLKSGLDFFFLLFSSFFADGFMRNTPAINLKSELFEYFQLLFFTP